MDGVKQYLIMKFDFGERIGNKVDFGKVVVDMRIFRKLDGLWMFERKDWFMKS